MTTDITAKPDDAFNAGLSGAKLPYAGTSGLGGSTASAEVRGEQDRDGTTGARQRSVMDALKNAGALGMTIRELGQHLQVKPGESTPSSMLSILHKSGDIARLATVRRNRQSVYVLPENIEGRAVAKHGGKSVKGEFNMTNEEIRLVENFVMRTQRQPQDQPFWISGPSGRAICAILVRAVGQVR